MLELWRGWRRAVEGLLLLPEGRECVEGEKGRRDCVMWICLVW